MGLKEQEKPAQADAKGPWQMVADEVMKSTFATEVLKKMNGPQKKVMARVFLGIVAARGKKKEGKGAKETAVKEKK